MATLHPVTPEDSRAMDAIRSMVEPNKGKLQGIDARAPFDAIMSAVAAPRGVTYRADVVGGIPGWWCIPLGAQSNQTILHLHGGWFNWGSAEAYRHLVGHIARSAGAEAFVPDYRLAPEHPFPAALNDIVECYSALIANGSKRIAITGDSAGGNLALVLLTHHGTNLPEGRKACRGSRIVAGDRPCDDGAELGYPCGSRPILCAPPGGGIDRRLPERHRSDEPDGISPLRRPRRSAAHPRPGRR